MQVTEVHTIIGPVKTVRMSMICFLLKFVYFMNRLSISLQQLEFFLSNCIFVIAYDVPKQGLDLMPLNLISYNLETGSAMHGGEAPCMDRA